MIVRPIGGGGGGGSPITGTPYDFVNIDATGTQGQDSGWSRDTDGTLAANSDLKIPTQKAVKTYVDNVGTSAFGWVNPVTYGASGSVVTTTATATHGSNVITLTSATSFATGHGIALLGVGSVEAFNGYTESDAGNYFTESATQCVITAIPDNVSNEYVYKDYTAGYFAGDLTFYGSWKLTANSGVTVAACCVFALDDTLAQPGNQATGNLIRINIQMNTTNTTFIMDAIYNGVNTEVTQTMGNYSGTQVWWKLTRVGAVWTCYLYSDAARTTLLYTKTLTATGISSYRYAYGVSGCNYGTTGTCTGFTENLYLFGLGNFEMNCPYITISGTTVTMYQTDKTTPFNWIGSNQTVTIYHDDTWAITQAIQTGKNVHIPRGNYCVHLMQGATSPIFALNNLGQIIEGEGGCVMQGNQGWAFTAPFYGGSNIIDRDPTADVFKITNSNVTVTDLGYTCDAVVTTKTAGYFLNVQGAATSISTWVQGVLMRFCSVLAGYGGLAINGYVDRSWFTHTQFLCQKNNLLVNNPTPHGDLHFVDLEMGTCGQTNAPGIWIKAADTNNYSNIKVNGSDPPLLIDASTGNVYNQRFVNCSFENGGYGTYTYNIQMQGGAGSIINTHFSNGEVGISGGGFYLGGNNITGTVIEAVSLYLLGGNAITVHGATHTSILGNAINGNVQAIVCDNSSSVITLAGNVSIGSLSIDNTCTRVGLGQGNKFAGGITAAPTASAGTLQTGSTDFSGTVNALSATACTITFRTGFNAVVPAVVITPINATAVSWALTALSATAFTVTFSAAVTGFSYRVIAINE